MNEDRIDISEPLQEICKRLGLEYNLVARIEFEPSRLRADVYRTDEKGRKYVDENSGVAIEWLDFKVTT